MAQCPSRTFREVSCAAKAAFRVRRHGETRRGRRRFHGGRGNASKPAVESTTPIADRRFAMPPGSWSRVAQLHPQNSLKSHKITVRMKSCCEGFAFRQPAFDGWEPKGAAFGFRFQPSSKNMLGASAVLCLTVGTGILHTVAHRRGVCLLRDASAWLRHERMDRR